MYKCQEMVDGDFNTFGDYQNMRIQGIIGGYLGLNVDLWGECTRPVNPTQYNNKQDVNVLPYLVDTYPNIRFGVLWVELWTNMLKTHLLWKNYVVRLN